MFKGHLAREQLSDDQCLELPNQLSQAQLLPDASGQRLIQVETHRGVRYPRRVQLGKNWTFVEYEANLLNNLIFM